MDEPRGFKEALSALNRVQAALDNAVVYCANAYGTKKYRDQPIVSRHFTRGNAERYGWPPLAASTLGQRLGGAKDSNAAAKAKGWRATGSDASVGRGTLPVLVSSGALRNAIENNGRVGKISQVRAQITWSELPDYAQYHYKGGSKEGRPPKRDFITPNEQDIIDLREIMAQFFAQATGQGRTSFAP